MGMNYSNTPKISVRLERAPRQLISTIAHDVLGSFIGHLLLVPEKAGPGRMVCPLLNCVLRMVVIFK